MIIRKETGIHYVFLKPINEKATLSNSKIQAVSFLNDVEAEKHFSGLLKNEFNGMETY